MLLIQAYLLFSVLLFAMSAWNYPVDNPLLFYGYLAAAHLALLVGYCRSVFKNPRGFRGRPSLNALVFASLAANLLLIVPTALFRTGGAFDPVAALTDPGAAYTQSLAARASTEPIVEYVRIVLGPVLLLLYPLTVFYWRRIRPSARALAILVLAGTVVTFVAMGTNKAIADTVLLFPWLVAAGHYAGQYRLTKRKVVSLVAAAAIGLGGMVLFFGRTMASRQGSIVAHGYFGLAGLSADETAPHVRILPPDDRLAALGLDFYLTHGYYALSLSLREPFEPCWGVGNSYFLLRQTARLLDDERILQRAYPYRIEKYGWDAEGVWSSIYPWIASDTSFLGSLIVIFLIGATFGAAWRDTLLGSNPFAVAMLSQFVIMLLYFPANNQVLQSGEGLVGFFGTLVTWLATRRGVARTQLAGGQGS